MMPYVFKKEGPFSFHSADCLPSVSLILPFEPRLMPKSQIEHGLKMAMDKVKEELSLSFPGCIVKPALNKLRSIMNGLEYNSPKKSIAIFLSPFEEKVYYLDIAVTEKIEVNKAFEFRDLLLQKEEERKYLLLAVSHKSSKIYLGNNGKLTQLVYNLPEKLSACEEETNERSGNGCREELVLEKFLKQVDYSISIILKVYPYPLFVMTDKKTLSSFIKVSGSHDHMVEHIPGNFDEATNEELLKTIQPYLEGWKDTRGKNLLLQLGRAAGKGKLAAGISEVWKAAIEKKGKLLVVEKDYVYPACFGEGDEIIYLDSITPGFSSQYLKDAVDEAIEKVLAAGGDVEFVERNVMKSYGHVALIQH